MKIQVGYHFDAGSFPGEFGTGVAAEGVVTTGPLGLVTILETRLGIASSHCGQPLRIARYLAAMDAACSKAKPFYKKSFKADGWSSAKRLLALRDQLRLSGWDGSAPGESVRLADLALLEGEAQVFSSLAERMEEVLVALSSYGITGLSEISLYAHETSEWPSCWRNLFVALGENGVLINTVVPDSSALADTDLGMLHGKLCATSKGPHSIKADGSITCLKAPTALEAADALGAWLAADENLEGDIVIVAESDSEVLDAAMCRHGLPRPGAASRSQWRAALQLLPLGLGVHWAPFDPQRYLEFLTAPICPLHPAMAYRLVRALEQEPGIGGKGWHQAVSDCEEWAGKQPSSEAYLDDLRFWTEVKRAAPHTGLDSKTVQNICHRLSEWAAKGTKSSEGRLMGAVSGMATEMAEAVAATGRKAIPKPQLDRMLDSVIGAGVVVAERGEAAPWSILTHPGQLGGSVDTVIWWNFTMGGMLSCRSPWTRAEEDALTRSGVHMNDMELERNLELASWKQAACNTSQKLVLVMPEQDGGEALSAHPFWENIVAVMNLSEKDDIPAITVDASQLRKGESALMGRRVALNAVKANAAIEFQKKWAAPRGVIGRREKESPSGMSQLIKCPLSWVLSHILKVKSTGSPSLPEDNLLRGSFSHAIVEGLINESCDWKPKAAVKRAEKLFDSRMKGAAAAFLLPGMETEREQFRSLLLRAVSDLFERIENTKLSVLESERRVERTDENGQKYRGYIDISLEDSKGNPVVWDMKWAWSSKRRREELEKGLALQLAAYCWLLDSDDKSSFGAYYMLAQTELISTRAPWLPAGDMVDSDLKATWDTARKRYDVIIDQLAAGKVEAIGPDEEDPDDDFNLGTGCFFCEYGMVCGVGYE
ncbi:MAG: PD-(D/E)XK nuclease family protein [Pseudodesulfovibrio sp.]|nr:PD-(D/E)XK nuclease family protein [Pseudodesulfovibrio sp.]